MGGSIIIPMLMRTLATTISMMRKGMNSMNPISNAVRNSEITNAGMSAREGTAASLDGFGSFAARMKSAISFSRVCLNMNSRKGTIARVKASCWFISLAMYGFIASWFTLSKTGVMIKKVRNRESPMITWLGGICCVLRACRSSERTITIRVKEVRRMRSAGASERRVSRRTIWTVMARSSGVFVFPTWILRLGRFWACTSAAPITAGTRKAAPKASRFPNRFVLPFSHLLIPVPVIQNSLLDPTVLFSPPG